MSTTQGVVWNRVMGGSEYGGHSTGANSVTSSTDGDSYFLPQQNHFIFFL
jgi:hypothetical protein